MEIFWFVVTFVILLSYGFAILFFNHKLTNLAESGAHGEHRRRGKVTLTVSRHKMQIALGAIWFLDGLFQLKPSMFSPSFVKEVILPTGQGQPSWMASVVNWGGHFVVNHLLVWNSLFALVQLALGVALIFNYRIKQTILASLIWSVVVWVFGEGAGQLLSGQTLLLNGAPGAVLLYGLLGVAIWPKNDGDLRAWRTGGIRFARLSLAILLTAGFVMHLQSPYLKPGGLSQAIAVPWIAKAIGSGGDVVSILLGFVELGLALMLFFKVKPRVAAWASILLSVLFWWVGQSFGQIFDPLATDFNSGILMALLAICSSPELGSHHGYESVESRVV